MLFFTKQDLGQNLAEKIYNGKMYAFVIECPMYKCSINGKVGDSTLLIAPPNAKFTLVDRQADICVIRFTLLPSTKKIKTNFYTKDDFTTYTYFLITKAQLDFKAVPILKSNIDLLVGNIFTPVKLRFHPFDFAKDICVGTTFGIKYSFHEQKEISIDGLLGIGVSSLHVDSLSSYSRSAISADILSFSASCGLVLEFGNAQLGLFYGYDFISNANQQHYQWIYRNKPWLSFGIGYSLFSFNVHKS